MEALLSMYRSTPIGVDLRLLAIGFWITLIVFALPAVVSVALWMARGGEYGRALYEEERLRARLEMLEEEKARERIVELRRSGEREKERDEERKKAA